jgi:BMFP domain-containing protein YqiC
MSEDITKELPMSTDEKIDQLFLMTCNVIQGMNQLEARMTSLEQNQAAFAIELASLKAGTNPSWQVMHDRQQQIWEMVREQSTRMDRIEARMDEVEAHLQRQDEKMEDGFRKLNDKFEIMSEEWFETRADLKHLKRRVTQLETINQ